MCCCSVSYVGCVLLFLTENMQIVNLFLFLCVNFLWVMQAFFVINNC